MIMSHGKHQIKIIYSKHFSERVQPMAGQPSANEIKRTLLKAENARREKILIEDSKEFSKDVYGNYFFSFLSKCYWLLPKCFYFLEVAKSFPASISMTQYFRVYNRHHSLLKVPEELSEILVLLNVVLMVSCLINLFVKQF